MNCECCNEKEVAVDCKQCCISENPGQWRHLCSECSAFIHRGAFKDHQLISQDLKKKRDDVKDKLVVFKGDRKWESDVAKELHEVKKEMQERLAGYENEIKRHVTEMNKQLKNKAIEMMKTLKDLTTVKTDVIDDIIKKLEDNVKTGKATETQLDKMIEDIGLFESEIGAYEDKLEYKSVEWDSSTFPKLAIPFSVNFKSIEVVLETFSMNMDDILPARNDKPDEVNSVTINSRIDNEGVFWTLADLDEDAIDKLLSISFDIRSRHLFERDWKTYDKLEDSPVIGQHVYALWANDNKWYRGRVEALFPEKSESSVVFVDFGNVEKIPFSAILSTEEHNVSDVPFQAVESSLFSEPRDIPMNIKFEISDMIGHGSLHCKFLGLKQFGEKEVKHVELIKDMPDGSTLNIQEYIEKRCDDKKKNVDMPFTSRDVRLLENPKLFDKTRTPESSPRKNEDQKDEKHNGTDEQSAKSINDKAEEITDSSVKPVSSDIITNGSHVSTNDLETKKDSSNVHNNSDDSPVIIEDEETKETYELPRANMCISESLQIRIDNPLHSDGSFWASLERTKEQNEDFNRLCEALNNRGEKSQQCATIQEGSMVLAFAAVSSGLKKFWHRAKVESVVDSKSKIRLIDYGTSVKLSNTMLRVLPLHYCQVPSQSLSLKLSSTKMATFSRDSIHHFQKLVGQKLLTAEIQAIGPKDSYFDVLLMDKNDSVQINILKVLEDREAHRLKNVQHEPETSPAQVRPHGPGLVQINDHNAIRQKFYEEDDFCQDLDPNLDLYGTPVASLDFQGEYPLQQAQQPTPGGHSDHGPQTSQPPYPSNDARLSGDYPQQRGDRRGGGGGGAWRGDRDNRPRTCFNCGDPNHAVKNCPTRPQVVRENRDGRRNNRNQRR